MAVYRTVKVTPEVARAIRRLTAKVWNVGIWNLPSPWRESWPNDTDGRPATPGVGTTIACAVDAMLASMKGD